MFCANTNHLQAMAGKALGWFSGVDSAPHIYCVWSDSDTAGVDYAAFKADRSDHLRLMFCIDMFNEGIHVEDIDGVILFRPTISPIIYKQQIGRALSTLGGNTPLIIDVVNNYENLYSYSSVQEELREFISFYRNTHQEEAIVNESFKILDETRECRQLFEALEETLFPSWEEMYAEACKYYRDNGNLLVPKRYRTVDNIPLGGWIAGQRGARKGTNGQTISDIRIKLLDKSAWCGRIPEKSSGTSAWSTRCNIGRRMAHLTFQCPMCARTASGWDAGSVLQGLLIEGSRMPV